jgi:hypothetical protein
MTDSLTYIEVSRFISRTGMSPTRIGREAAGDPRLVDDLRRGRQIRADLTARVRDCVARQEQRGQTR